MIYKLVCQNYTEVFGKDEGKFLHCFYIIIINNFDYIPCQSVLKKMRVNVVRISQFLGDWLWENVKKRLKNEEKCWEKMKLARQKSKFS